MRKSNRTEIINAYKDNCIERCSPETVEIIISDTVPDKQIYSTIHLVYLKIVITILVYAFIGVLILWLFGAFSERVQNIMGGIFVLMIISTFVYRISKVFIKKFQNNIYF